MSRTRWFLAVASLAIAMTACSGDDPPEPAEPAGPSANETTGSTGADPAADPLEGTWTAVITPELAEQAAETAGLAPTADSLEDLFGGRGPVTIVVTFGEGRLIHTANMEGEQPEVGWEGDYEIVDDDTVIAGDAGDLYIEYTYSIRGDELVLDMVRDDFSTVSEEELAGEIYAQTVIYESAPFIRES